MHSKVPDDNNIEPGGLITSTALTLVIVPAVFCWIDDLERYVSAWLARRVLTSGAHESHLSGKPAPLGA